MYKNLLDKANSSTLTKDEIDYAAHQLQQPISNADIHSLLLVLGKAHATQYTALIERFLEYEPFPMVSALAIGILCRDWHQERRYLNYLLRFLRGVPWDREKDCLRAAISLSGSYLRGSTSVELLRELLRIFDHYIQDMLSIKNEYGDDKIALLRAERELSLKNQFDFAKQYGGLTKEEAIARLELSFRYDIDVLMADVAYDALKDVLGFNPPELLTKGLNINQIESDEVVKKARERLEHEPPASLNSEIV